MTIMEKYSLEELKGFFYDYYAQFEKKQVELQEIDKQIQEIKAKIAELEEKDKK